MQVLPYLPYTRPTLHVAGTNGKGSISALLNSILLASSPPLHVGRFNSPHLVSVLDCITLDGRPVSEDLYFHARNQVEDADRAQGTNLTGFEILAMTALRVFENERVDVVVLEVGMGGRLDATNIVPDESILVSALAAVDLDHQAFLGDTVALIAREKAGIARPGKPFVLGKQAHPEVEDIVKEVLGTVGGVLVRALEVKPDDNAVRWSLREMDPTKDVSPPPQPVAVTMKSFPDPLHALLPLHGAHQLDNLGTALGVVDALLDRAANEAAPVSLDLKSRITPESIVKGIQNVKWPGRLSFHTLSVPVTVASPNSPSTSSTETVNLVVLVDGAHNPASAKTLGAYITHLLALTHAASASNPIQSQSPDFFSVPITYILSLSQSPQKTPLQTLSPILPPAQPQPQPPSPSPSAPLASHASQQQQQQHAPSPPPGVGVVAASRKGMSMGSGSGSGSFPVLSTSVNIRPIPSVALLRFTPPEGMPWVKSVPPSEMKETVRELMPLLREEDLWVAPEVGAEGEEGRNKALEDALRWAAAKQAEGDAVNAARQKGRGLVVLAGSLYLVADFYRLLERGF